MSIFQMERLGTIMEPEPGNPREIEGVLSPEVIRGPDGELYIFPRLVVKGNYSCIGIAKVIFNESSDPLAVQGLGIVLEPEMPYEKRLNGGGSCEDLISYRPYKHIDFNNVNNKDACLFLIDVLSPHHHLSIAVLRRPLFRKRCPRRLRRRSLEKQITGTRKKSGSPIVTLLTKRHSCTRR